MPGASNTTCESCASRDAKAPPRQRGAAIDEAFVVIPFFIAFALSFTGKLYRDKLSAIGEAKNRAWATALRGCRGDEGDSVVGESGGADLDDANGAPGRS